MSKAMREGEMKQMTTGKMKEKIITYLKGVLMGICDLIPGISGGTIAFITGIYARLMNAVKGFSLGLAKEALLFLTGKGSRERLADNVRKLDLGFLLTLLAGIATAILGGAHGMSYLLERHFTLTLSFFVGLILSSSGIIYRHIEKRNAPEKALAVLGLLAGLGIAFVIPVNPAVSLSYVFLGGFLGISAMFLPGISGSFILLILGLYGFMLKALSAPFENLPVIATFLAGAACGAYVISRMIVWLFEKDRCRTLSVLLGLVIGALALPVREVISGTVWGLGVAAWSAGLLGLGVAAGVLIERGA